MAARSGHSGSGWRRAGGVQLVTSTPSKKQGDE
jgi:hypothetical protein